MNKAPIDVVQLAGGFAGVEPEFNAPQVVIDTAAQLNGRGYLLYAPSATQAAEARSVLWHEPTVRQTIDLYDGLSALITGVGALLPSRHRQCIAVPSWGLVLQQELNDTLTTGDTCCHFIDPEGRLIDSFEDRIVGISTSQIRKTLLRISAAFGTAKVPAIRARSSRWPAQRTRDRFDDRDTAPGLIPPSCAGTSMERIVRVLSPRDVSWAEDDRVPDHSFNEFHGTH